MEKQIQDILDYFKLSSAQFAEKLNIQRSNVSHLLSGRNKPSLDLIQKILTNFPEISSDWLLFNKGEMIKGKTDKQSSPNPTINPPEKKKQDDPSKDISNLFDTPTPTKPVSKPKTVNKNKASQKAKRVIILNEDNTFEEYFPNN